MYGFIILCEISKGTFETSHKTLNPYTALHLIDFYFCTWFTISLHCDVICPSETGPSSSSASAVMRCIIVSNVYSCLRIEAEWRINVPVNYASHSSDDGSSPTRCGPIVATNASLLSIELLRSKFVDFHKWNWNEKYLQNAGYFVSASMW